ncbi:MAG: alpha/beta hydrolase family protein [Opitutales bacterium]
MLTSSAPVRRSLLALLALLILPTLRAETPKPEPPRDPDKLIDVLFRAPEFEYGQLSPDGSHLAYTLEARNHKVIATYDFALRKLNLAGGNFRQDVRSFHWAGPHTLILDMGQLNIFYVGIWLVDENLQHPYEVQSRDQVIYTVQDALPQRPDIALLREQARDRFFSPLYELHIKTHTIVVRESNQGNVVGWLPDLQGVPRIATVAEPGGGTSYLSRQDADSVWQPENLPRHAEPLGFDASGHYVLISYPDATSRSVVQTYDLGTHRLIDQPLADPNYDMADGLIRDPQTGGMLGLRCQREKPTFLWFQPEYKKLHDLLQRSFPGMTVNLTGPLADRRFLFSTESDISPPTYYIFNPAKRQIDLLFTALPEADGLQWAPVKPVSFSARDGYVLHGYLTLPRHRPAGRPGPLIALVHGGPQVRDTWGFEPEVQFLAALGYTVLQVDYRGSAGYGEAHELKTNLDVAEKSVDDVADELRWAVEQHLADPKRLAVYGGSYGGYVALGLATRYPELPAAVIGFAGVYDWREQMRRDGVTFSKLLRWRQDYYVDPATALERYRAVTPVDQADRVRCPVLLLHGGEDLRVDIAQTKLMAAALQAAGKSVEVVKDAQGIHGLPLAEQRVTYYRKLAEFLTRNVPVDPAP